MVIKLNKFLNLTPHAIHYEDAASKGIREVAPSGAIARVTTKPGDFVTHCESARIYESPTWGIVEGLPPQDGETCFIVSLLVLQRCKGREDVVSPATGPNDDAVRSLTGQIKYVTRFIRAEQIEPTTTTIQLEGPILDRNAPMPGFNRTFTLNPAQTKMMKQYKNATIMRARSRAMTDASSSIHPPAPFVRKCAVEEFLKELANDWLEVETLDFYLDLFLHEYDNTVEKAFKIYREGLE